MTDGRTRRKVRASTHTSTAPNHAGVSAPEDYTVSRSSQFAIAILLFAGLTASAQSSLLNNPDRSLRKTEVVEYLYPEQLTIAAGQPAKVELHFRIAPGLHINSHTPRDKFLIPTALSFPADSGVKLDGATYPAGVEYTLPADPETHLNVYTGDFAIQARLSAQPGDHLVQAKLRYQACDATQCMPPKTATIAIDVVGK